MVHGQLHFYFLKWWQLLYGWWIRLSCLLFEYTSNACVWFLPFVSPAEWWYMLLADSSYQTWCRPICMDSSITSELFFMTHWFSRYFSCSMSYVLRLSFSSWIASLFLLELGNLQISLLIYTGSVWIQLILLKTEN